jgi:hypothetical protein
MPRLAKRVSRIPHEYTRTRCRKYYIVFFCVGLAFLTAVIMMSSLFWDVTPCSLLKINRRFVGTSRRYLQCPRIRKSRNQHETGSKQSSIPPKRRLIFNGLHGVISKNNKAGPSSFNSFCLL